MARTVLTSVLAIALFGCLGMGQWMEGVCPPDAPGSYCALSRGGFLTFSPDGRYLATVSDDEITIFALPDYEKVRLITAPQPWMNFGIPSFSADGSLLAAPMSGGLIGVWNVESGEDLITITTPTGPYLRVALSPGGESLANIAGGKVEIWDITSGTEIKSFGGDSAPLIALAFSPDGALLAGGGEDRTLRVWNIESGEEVFSFTGFSHEVPSVAFSPDRSLLCAASGDGTIRIWDLTTGEERFVLTGHSEAVTSVAFSPDGNVIASASRDDTVRLWDVRSGTGIYTLDLWEILGPLSPDNVADPKGLARAFVADFSPNGELLGTAYCGVKLCQIDLWNIRDILGE